MKNLKKKSLLFLAILIVLFTSVFSCDMEPVEEDQFGNSSIKNGGSGGGGILDGGGLGGGGGGSGDLNEEKIKELERNGHYVMLYHLPAGTTTAALSIVNISDGTKQIARTDSASEILISNNSPYCNVYIPLVTPSGGIFNRTGSFYITVTVQLDALTRIAIKTEHNVIVEFTDGKGVLDIEKLVTSMPGIVEEIPDPEREREKQETEQKINDIINGGGYVKFYNLPRNTSKNSFLLTTVLNSSSTVARCADYSTVAVRKNVLTSEAFVPLTKSRDGNIFDESGKFYVAFNIVIDALTRLVVEAGYARLYLFEDGHTDIDSANIPSPPQPPPVIPHCLVIGGLPDTANAPNISDVFVYNSAGVTAKSPDYTKITFITYNGHRAAVIPLVYDNNRAFNGQEFAESGNLLVTFNIFPDAVSIISVVSENACIIPFKNGSAFIDISDVPPIPRNCLTITHLPKNLQLFNISKVFVLDQSGKIAECQDYDLLEIFQENELSTLRIPLVYKGKDVLFSETGPFYVSFDLNVDALNRILIADTDNQIANFINGNATLDARTLPQALPTPYFTIMGLPLNTAKGNFSDVFLYNGAGKIAKCADYANIVISKNSTSATAMIPLAYNSGGEFFRDSGEFVVTFTINVDINTQIVKERADSLGVQFTDGSGELNLSSDYGYFSGELKNPLDTSPLVLKKGMIFEINGGYVKLTADTSIPSSSFDSTCVVYVYASKSVGNVVFEYSKTQPVFNVAKNAYYSNNKRALYKFLYIKDTINQYVAKVYIDDSWTEFDHYVIDNVGLSNIAENKIQNISGASNQAMQTISYPCGWYVFTLCGAGGGGGAGIDGFESRNRYGGPGGSGGYICVLSSKNTLGKSQCGQEASLLSWLVLQTGHLIKTGFGGVLGGERFLNTQAKFSAKKHL
ncbi:MAG: hypothetical protein Ta2G_18630 [Termitinemataceae bacterium]|nr:MAG: hypothetical protein Ta2G_18630 [Termitinemataceae bacterium]